MNRLAALALALVGCRVEVGAPAPPVQDQGDAPAGEVWIYTSMYPSVIEQLEPLLRERWPGIAPKWVQAGSEKVAQRLEAEWSAGGSKACLVATSDPFWYAEQVDAGRLAPHLAPNVLRLDRTLVDLDGYWAAARISLMVMAVNGERVPEAERPRRFADLADPRWADRVTLPDPLASGTMFTTLSFWTQGSWDLVEALDRNGVVAAGGSAAVISRLESGEKDVGVLLLENVLAARRKGSPLVAIAPEDGAIAIPGPLALTAGCPNPAAARAVYDFLLSPEGQQLVVAGDMYAAVPDLPPPAGAPALGSFPVLPWSEDFVRRVVAEKGSTRERWARLVSEGP